MSDTAGLAAHRVRRQLTEFLAAHAEPGDRLLLAVSGGADSLALAAAAAAIAPQQAVRLSAASIDHALQPGSRAVAAAAVAAIQGLGVADAVVIEVEVSAGEGLEAAARVARYAALQARAAAVGARAILLAHTMEDQAETVLLRLTRGSGPRSLGAMRPVTEISGGVPLWRPLLTVSRADLAASLAASGLTPHLDPHNLDERFLRVRVREQLMPLVRQVLGPGVDAALLRSAELAAQDADALDGMAAALVAELDLPAGLPLTALADQPLAIQRRLVRTWLLAVGVPAADLAYEHITAVHRLATDPRVQGPVRVPGGVEVRRASGRLRA